MARHAHRSIGRAALFAVLASIMTLGPVAAAQTTEEITVRKDLELPAGPLSQSIIAISTQFGVPIVAPDTLVADKQATAVSGSLTIEQALTRALTDTGLRAIVADNGGIVIARQSNELNTITLGTLVVTGEAPGPSTGTIGQLPAPFAGGQVATGQQLGVLGNRDRLDTPLSTTSITAELIENQQSTDYYQVIQNFPSLQATTTPNQGVTNFQSRGIQVARGSIGFNGTTNLFSDTQPSLVGIERVESFRGPSTLFTGQTASFGSVVGGTINFVPKRAGEKDVNSVKVGFQSDAIGDTQFDFGRRFGPENEWGLRIGGELLGGDTQVDFGERQQRGFALALDYNKDRLRAVLDVRYNEVEQEGHTREFFGAAGPTIPTSFDADTNNNQPWAFMDNDTLLGALRVEYDILPETTVFGVASGSIHNRTSLTGFPSNLQANGDFTTDVGDFRDDDNLNGNLEVGIRSTFDTGSVSHNAVAAVNYAMLEETFAFVGFNPAQAFQNNIFSPIVGPNPGIQATEAVGPTLKSDFFGVTLVDTLGFLDDRLQVTAGLRYQEMRTRNFDAATGAETSESEGNKVSPGVGVLFKATDHISVYANYLEGLSNGGTAPLSAANPNEQLGPIVSDSIEVGTKFNTGNIGVDVALFQISDITSGVDPVTNIFGEVGKRRVRGLEISAFGELTKGLRLLSGVTFFDSEIIASDVAANVGQDGPGIPDHIFSLDLEYDVPALEGLTLTGGLRHQGEALVILGNDVEIPSWTTVDLGARYTFDKYTARFSVENVFDETYFNGSPFGELALGTPRTVLVSLTYDF